MDANNVFSIQTSADFERCALDVFAFQLEHCRVYAEYCQAIGRTEVSKLEEIPFLPISFFKTHQVLHEGMTVETVFKSSGTTGQVRSQHFVQNLALYERSFLETYIDQIGQPEEQVILALLPSYLEQGESSLVYMVDRLVKETRNALSGFLLNEVESIQGRYQKAVESGKKVIIFGVSYALLDLAEKGVKLPEAIILETGGMKGRRKEMTKEELHTSLCDGLGVESIASEYGMTELLSQGYALSDGLFQLPPWMKIVLRETNDPFALLQKEKTGGVNVIDLANLYSCSFIATQDLGRMEGKFFRIMGRFDHAEVRGCNLLVQ